MTNGKRSITLRIGWIMLVIVGVGIAAAGAASLRFAYLGDEVIAGIPVDRFAQLDPDLPKLLRARRATAASYALMSGVLVAWIAATAFRGGQKWAWWAVLTAVGLGCAGSLLRLPLLDVRPGIETALTILGAVVVALAISYRDFNQGAPGDR